MQKRFQITVLFLLALMLPAASLSAQQPTEAMPADRDSPRAAMFTFLRVMNEIEKGEDERWPEVYPLLGEPDPGPEIAHLLRRRAVKLKESLDYIGRVDEDELPQSLADDYFVYFPKALNETHEKAVKDIGTDKNRIAFQTRDTLGWTFSEDTFAGLDELHGLLLEHRNEQYDEQTYGDGGKFLAELMPNSLKSGTILGLYYWQWLALAALILLGVVVDQLLRTILRGAFLRQIDRAEHDEQKEQLAKTVRPFGFVAGGVLVMLGLTLVGLPDLAHRFLYGAVAVFTVLAGILAAWQLIDLVASVAFAKAEETKTKFDDILVPMFAKAAKIFAVAIGIVYAAQALNLPIVPLLGSLGIGSLAFAFAAKDTIENFFGSVSVILDRPFEVGDWVVFDGKTEGTVEELGFRSTRIRTFYNSQITVPNATLVRATVDNYGRRTYRRWKTHIGVQYDTPPDKLIAFTEGIRELVRSHPYTRKDYFQVWLHRWSASSMDVLLYIFFEVPDWSTELRERERMFVDIVRLADKLGVQFAFPTQTVHLYKEEHKPHEVQHETPGGSTDKRSMVQGIRTARELVSQQTWHDNPPGPVSYSLDGVESLLDEAGNATLVEKEDATDPTGDEPVDPKSLTDSQ
ncbi:MAG: mechanosensitive ion channel family protein [Phycisphaeraceae bacterium]|nr:mechanosensitive ion channel family protein [Phycisphaeraceae bacterium]